MARDRDDQLAELVHALKQRTDAGNLSWTRTDDRSAYQLVRDSGTVVVRGPVFPVLTQTYQLEFLDRDGKVVEQYTEDSMTTHMMTAMQSRMPIGAVRELWETVRDQIDQPSPAIDRFMGEL